MAVVAYESGNADIWVHDLTRGARSRLISGPEPESYPVWSRSADRLFFVRAGNVLGTLMEVPADGSEAPRIRATDVSIETVAPAPDGRTLVFGVEKEGRSSLWRLDLEGGGDLARLSPNPVHESLPAISPDGRWLAYVSDEAGPAQVFHGGAQPVAPPRS